MTYHPGMTDLEFDAYLAQIDAERDALFKQFDKLINSWGVLS